MRVHGSGQYEGAVRGVDIRAVQTQGTDSPTLVSTAAAGWIAATSVSVGFAFMSTSVINDDVLVAGVVTAKHSRWCGQDIEAGDVVLYGPEALHTASNPQGFAVTFAVVPAEDVGPAASLLGSGIEHLTGRFVRLPPTPATRRLGLTVAGAFRAAFTSHLFAPPPLASLCFPARRRGRRCRRLVPRSGRAQRGTHQRRCGRGCLRRPRRGEWQASRDR